MSNKLDTKRLLGQIQQKLGSNLNNLLNNTTNTGAIKSTVDATLRNLVHAGTINNYVVDVDEHGEVLIKIQPTYSLSHITTTIDLDGGLPLEVILIIAGEE